MKRIIIYMCLLLFCYCKNNEPIKHTSDILKNENVFLTKIDSIFKEPDLTKGVDSTVETYRIWRLCAFKDDTSNVIIIENKSDEIITLTQKKFIYKHSMPISTDSVFYSQKRHLNLEDWRLFKDKIYFSYFWNLTNSNDDDIIIDCNTYIFEGARCRKKYNKSYNVFAAECPQGSLHEIYYYLWNLSRTPQ